MARVNKFPSILVKPAILTAADTLTDSEAGKTFFLNAAGGFEVVLPRPRAGLNFEFIVKTAPTTGNYLISTMGDLDLVLGQIITTDNNSGTDPDFATTAVNDINFVANTAVAGDSVRLISDGTYWYATGYCSVYNAITLD